MKKRSFVDVLNDSTVTFIRDLGTCGWNALAGLAGFEVISPTGEVRAFISESAARAWRLSEVRNTYAYEQRWAR